MPNSRVFALVLAAGQSRRFGGDKLTVELNGQPLLAHVLNWVAEAREHGDLAGGLAVLPEGNPDRESILLGSRLEYVFNGSPERGVAESLRIGLAALAARHPDAEAALVAQGDQPRLRREVIPMLLSAWSATGRPVVRPRYAGEPDTPGHPVLLDRSIWERARELDGDAGFAPLLRKYPDLVTTVDVPGVNPDINTPSDLTLVEFPDP